MPNFISPVPGDPYVVGDTATVTFTLTVPGTPAAGQPLGTAPTYIDPGPTTVRVEPPTQAGYTLTVGVSQSITRVSAGVYRVAIPVTEPSLRGVPSKKWLVRWHSTANVAGQGAGVKEATFDAVASALQQPN